VTFVRGNKLRTERKKVITEDEFKEMLHKATRIKDDKSLGAFFRLRALALLSILWLTGKRRGELATLMLDDVKVEGEFLNLTFTLEKKRKGHVLTKRATKSVPLTNEITRHILNYVEYLKKLQPTPKYLFPRVKSVFGHNIIIPDKHLTGRQLFNIVRSLSESVWPHLFRETAASNVIRQDSSIIGAFKVMRRLDLKDYRTGFRYLMRYASDIIERELEKGVKHVGS